ncbi:hypothetical protein, partial [Mesorhizobium sp. M7A.F.Ca.CA.004.06.1.1]|uniref:hypothetical protein n=1 Tax=Mesorhizobium sp. M7A.F.Ca.CA.004.06.1.1 TaxID=2496686 RepID=UPI0019CF73C3
RLVWISATGFARRQQRPGRFPACLVNVPAPKEFLISEGEPPFSRPAIRSVGSLCLNRTF